MADGLDSASFTPYVESTDLKVARHVPQDLRPGQNVFHSHFGPGKVLSVEGHGMDTRAQINFEKAGAKWLALSVAKLVVMPE